MMDPSPVSPARAQSGDNMSDVGPRSMAPYLATPTFSGREADSPIIRGANLDGDNTKDMDDRNVEEPSPWRLGDPYYRTW